ncbi:hypothetical protein DDT56_04675 [Brenneria corticis]|uniref:Transmembrane protein n=1 Tax=Brenneria corticis TaxID=2173106 RepID=A0A2U1U939_9GAMM|nr:hypothetical protein DDT56_04675 [Brenneria sp. CFCC 11842]
MGGFRGETTSPQRCLSLPLPASPLSLSLIHKSKEPLEAMCILVFGSFLVLCFLLFVSDVISATARVRRVVALEPPCVGRVLRYSREMTAF